MQIINFMHLFIPQFNIQIIFSQVGIEKFDKTKLSHTETLVKNILPTQEVIALEKSQ